MGRFGWKANAPDLRAQIATALHEDMGLTSVVFPQSAANPTARFLHDGRARTLTEAILWHAGEAQKSRDRFRAMSAADRAALLRFLDSL